MCFESGTNWIHEFRLICPDLAIPPGSGNLDACAENTSPPYKDLFKSVEEAAKDVNGELIHGIEWQSHTGVSCIHWSTSV